MKLKSKPTLDRTIMYLYLQQFDECDLIVAAKWSYQSQAGAEFPARAATHVAARSYS